MNLKHLLRPSIWDYHFARRFYGHLIRNRKFQLRSRRLTSKSYLNAGCGGNPRQGFINLDYGWHPNIDLCWDITKGIPLKKNVLCGIFTEHCLEHISFEEVYRALLDFHRMLRPNGTLRIAVPDGELYLNLYQKSQSDPEVQFPGGPLPHTESENGITPMIVINRAFRAFGHLFVYDYKTLAFLLDRAGFVDIRRTSFRQGRDETLLVDYKKRASNSLYVEASMPDSVQENRPTSSSCSLAPLVRYLEGGPL